MSKPKFDINGEIRKHEDAIAVKKAELRAIVSTAEGEQRDLNAEEDANFRVIEGEIRGIQSRIDRLKTIEGIQVGEATDANQRQQATDKEAEQRAYNEAYDQFLRNGFAGMPGEMRQLLEARALDAKTGNKGAYTIPQGFANKLEVALKATGGFLEACGLLETGTGNDIPYPTMNDTANEGAIVGTAGATDETSPGFGVVILKAHTFTSKPILVSNELLQDSAFNLDQYLADAMAERINRAFKKFATTGTGVDQPDGILPKSVKGADAAAAAITGDNLIDLMTSVDENYRKNGSWMMTDNTFKALRKLKGTDGQYMFQTSLRDGEPSTLLGRPIFINNNMDEIGTAKKSVIFGDLSKYLRRRVTSAGVKRLDEKYAESNQTGFILFLRQDGKLIDAGTNPIKHLLHA